MKKDADYWIRLLELAPHPEGGYYKETYRAPESISQAALPARYHGDRVFGTSIYFLLKSQERSSFHRLASDEIWHYHQGGSADIHMVFADGKLQTRRIGAVAERGDSLQVAIPKGCWFAAEVSSGDFILVGCTVAPGFEFDDFELGGRQQLLTTYPQHKTLIEKFTNIQP